MTNFLRTATLSGVIVLSAGAAPAWAQGYGTASSTSATGGQVGQNVDLFPGDGIRLSESALLHVGVGAEAGYDTNVYYNDAARTSATMLQVVPFFNISNAGRQGEPAQSFGYTIGANLAYRQYLSDVTNNRVKTAFNPSANVGVYARGNRVGFALSDTFSRIEEPPYFPTQAEPITRDHNQALAQVSLSPGGGRITTLVRYTNQLDIYEGDLLDYGNNMHHRGTIDTSWKWLPKTALFLRLEAGYVHYLSTPGPGQPVRHNSIPLGAGLGIRGMITPKLSSSVDLGYGTALYEGSSRVSGVGNINAAISLAYKLGYATSLGLGYGHGFRNSPIIGDYYNLDSVYVGASQGVGRLVFTLDGRYEWRRYRGPGSAVMGGDDRSDHVAIGQAKADFFIQKWFYAGIGYNMALTRSNVEAAATATGNNVDFVKHQILGRIGFTY